MTSKLRINLNHLVLKFTPFTDDVSANDHNSYSQIQRIWGTLPLLFTTTCKKLVALDCSPTSGGLKVPHILKRNSRPNSHLLWSDFCFFPSTPDGGLLLVAPTSITIRPGQIHTNSGDFLDIYSQMMMSDWGGVLHHRNETQVVWFFNGSMSHTISQFRWLPGSLGNPLIRRSKFAELPGSKKRIHGRFLFVCFVHPKNHGLKRGVWMSIARVWDLQQQVLRSHDS